MNSEVTSTEVSNKERSLRSTPPVYSPSFFISHGHTYQNQTFCIPSDGSYHVRSVPELRGMFCVGSSYGWLILRCLYKKYREKCHLFNPVTLTKIELPALPDHGSFDDGVISCPPGDPNCVVMFFHLSKDDNEDESEREKNFCIFCRIGDKSWIQQELSNEILMTTHVVSSKGKIYLYCFPWMLVIHVQDNVASIDLYNMPIYRHLVTVFTADFNYMLESCGDIFLIKAIRLGVSTILQDFLVFKLDLSKMAWQPVESLGNRIFLLGENSDSVSVSPSEFGAKGNCIYFFAYPTTALYCFDMEVGTIMVTQPCPTKFPKWAGPFWVVPNCKEQVKKQVAEATKEFQVISSNLPSELLSMIFQSLRLGDRIRFRLACKASISMASPIRSFPLQILPDDSQHLPWLISLPNTKKKSICHLYHPIYTDAYTMSLPQLAGATVRHAKFGWLLMSSGQTSHFFFNPSTLDTVQLPSSMRGFLCISFSAPPTSSDCVVFGHCFAPAANYVDMSVYRKSQNRWSRLVLRDLSYTFVPATCNPVFRKNAFYCLSKDGKLGVFNPNATNEEDMWMAYADLSVRDVRVTPQSNLIFNSTRSFIMDCDGEIFSVYVGFLGNPVRVYKLDQSKTKMKWVKVTSLGDTVMFLSHTTSLLIPAGLKGIENRIYFPRFKENASIFYALKSKKYNCFGEQISRENWQDTCEHWNCTWFQATK